MKTYRERELQSGELFSDAVLTQRLNFSLHWGDTVHKGNESLGAYFIQGYLCFEIFTEQEADTFCMEDYNDVGCGGGGGGG